MVKIFTCKRTRSRLISASWICPVILVLTVWWMLLKNSMWRQRWDSRCLIRCCSPVRVKTNLWWIAVFPFVEEIVAVWLTLVCRAMPQEVWVMKTNCRCRGMISFPNNVDKFVIAPLKGNIRCLEYANSWECIASCFGKHRFPGCSCIDHHPHFMTVWKLTASSYQVIQIDPFSAGVVSHTSRFSHVSNL